jgi:DNA-binding response OmpR family regulator
MEENLDKKTILIVDDEKTIVDMLVYNLQKEGYSTLEANDGEEAVKIALESKPDLVLLDIMLPKMDGLAVCKRIRQSLNIPILMISAKDEEIDKILGLELGADDYITKPFNILEVKARIKAIFRRSKVKDDKEDKEHLIVYDELRLDCDSKRVHIGTNEINLTAKEFDLLEHLAVNPDKVYSRENLLNIVWGYDYPGDVRTVDVHVRRLREKIEENPSEPKYIHTKWGVGYFFRR